MAAAPQRIRSDDGRTGGEATARRVVGPTQKNDIAAISHKGDAAIAATSRVLCRNRAALSTRDASTVTDSPETPMSLLPRHRPQRNWGARVREVEIDGLPLIELENKVLRVGILAGKGADLVEWLWKPRDVDLAWRSPWGIAHPGMVPASDPDPVASFMDVYHGGWQTVFPHGSVPARPQGTPYGQHGEAHLLPWDAELVEDTADAVEVKFSLRLRRMPFLLERWVRLEASAPSFTYRERATNLCGVELTANWGQHVTFGPPFLEPGCRIVLPDGVTVGQHGVGADEVRRSRIAGDVAWPTVTGADGAPLDLSVIPAPGTASEMVYLEGFGREGWYAVEQPRLKMAAKVRWDASLFPVCWLWQEFGASTAWPFFGQAYVIGLEPFAARPPLGEVTREAMTFAPGEAKTVWIEASVEAW